MTDDDRFDEWLAREARTYHEPPPAPRDAMWERIEAARRSRRAPAVPLRHPRRTWWLVAAGMAASLLLGVWLGGRGVARHPATDVASAPAGAAPAGPASPAAHVFDAAAAENLDRAEVLLTSFQVESRSGRVDPRIGRWASDLLSSTRLLLDSPNAQDPQLRKLLGDLELVLAQIAQLRTTSGATNGDLQLIDDAVRTHDMMTRLRHATPAPVVAAGS